MSATDIQAYDGSGSEDIRPTDIVFDCPACTKSLAIDYRGAGLTIPCTDCGVAVEVPIPEGMDLDDIDRSIEEQDIQIIHLRKALDSSQHKIHDLEAELEELDSRRVTLEKTRTSNLYRIGAIIEKTGLIEKALDDIRAALKDIVEIAKDEDSRRR
jgi:transcription elongation factor Elf1